MAKGIEKILRLENGSKVNVLRVKYHYLQQLFWECTLRCNLKCKHCGSNCTAEDSRGEMPLTDFLQVLDEIRKNMSHPILVITTGGEPLMRKDIMVCGREITKRGFYWGMVTNGTYLTTKVLNSLLDAGLNSISVSLDGLQNEHNWMRGSLNSFKAAINAIDILAQTQRCLTWDVITCINKYNIEHLEELKQLLIEHGVTRWKIFTVFPMGRAEEFSEMDLDKENFIRLMTFISESRKEATIKVSYGCENFLGQFEYEVRDNQYFCAAGVNVASIRFDGSISGCLSIRYNYNEGNIYKDSFVETWNNCFQQYRNYLWKKKGVCTSCEAWRWCQGNGMHLRDDNGNLKLCNYQKIYHDKNNNYKI